MAADESVLGENGKIDTGKIGMIFYESFSNSYYKLGEKELRKRGGIFQAKANWVTNVVTDERLITGQNPGSAGEVGEAIVKLLS